MPDPGKIDAVLDLVGNRTILAPAALPRRGGHACPVRWLDDLAPIADFNPLLRTLAAGMDVILGSSGD